MAPVKKVRFCEPPPPRPATRSVVAAEAYERRLKLTDVIGFVAQNGYVPI